MFNKVTSRKKLIETDKEHSGGLWVLDKGAFLQNDFIGTFQLKKQMLSKVDRYIQ